MEPLTDLQKQQCREILKRSELSKREKEVLEAACKYARQDEMADALFISMKTVKYHLTNIYRKMGVKNRAGMLIEVIDRKDRLEIEKASVPFPATGSKQKVDIASGLPRGLPRDKA